MDYATIISKIEELKSAKVEALKLISEQGYEKMKAALLRQCTRETTLESINSLLTVASNYEKLGLDAKVGLVAAAVAGEMAGEMIEPEEKSKN